MTNWRKSVKLALLLVVLEGGIRKWVLPQASDYVYFLKDLVLILAYFQYYSRPDKKPQAQRHPVLIYLFAINGILISAQAFNPNLGSPLTGLFGSRSYLLYLPLYFLVGELFRTPQELYKFLRVYMLLALPVCLLGIAQFFAPIDSPVNTYAPSASSAIAVEDVASFGEVTHARITGTFPYLAGHGTYTFTWILLGLGVWLHTRNIKWKLILTFLLLLLQLNIFMTGSRTPVYTLAIALVMFALLGLNSRSRAERRSIVALAGIAFCLIGGVSLVPAATQAFAQRASNAGDDIMGRFTAPYTEPFEFFEQAGLLGYGAGIVQGGSEAIQNAFHLPAPTQLPPPLENESTRVLIEIGWLGFLFWYAMRATLLWFLWKTYKGLQLPFLRQLALLAFLIHALTFGSQMVLNTTAGVYYWFLSGFILLLPRLQKIANVQQLSMS